MSCRHAADVVPVPAVTAGASRGMDARPEVRFNARACARP